MKNTKYYLNQVEKITKEIETKTNLINELSNKTFIREAIQNNNMEQYKSLKAEADKNESEIVKLSNEIETFKIMSKLVFDNAKYIMAQEVLEIVGEVLPQFNNKRLGAVTEKKLNEALKANGKYYIYVHKSEYGRTEINAYAQDNKYYYSLRVEMSVYKENSFIIDNTIIADNFNAEDFSTYAKFTENPRKTAKDILKKWEKVRKINEELNVSISELNSLLPSGINHKYNQNHFYNDIMTK